MQTKFIIALGTSTLLSNVSAEDPRAVRNCDQSQLPSLATGAEWSCKGNACGISCAAEDKFYKNQMFCQRDLTWKVTSDIEISAITCKRFPRSPKFQPECDIDNAPTPGENGNVSEDSGEWICDKRIRRCKLKCENDHRAKTQIICNGGIWSTKGKNTCSPPVSRTCDHLATPDFGEGELTCRRGKSCMLKCNDHVIQGAVTCKGGEWVKRNPDMTCCSNKSKPLVTDGEWQCKDKKFTSVCKLNCTNGKKGRTLMRCESNAWQLYGDGEC